MQLTPLTSLERMQGGFTHRINVTHSDLTQTTANTAQVITLRGLPIGALVMMCALAVLTKFQNSGDGAFNTTAVTVGDTGTANKYVTSAETNANGSAVAYKEGTGTLKAYTSADSLQITFNSMSGKSLVNLDTGELVVLLKLAHLDQLAGAPLAIGD